MYLYGVNNNVKNLHKNFVQEEIDRNPPIGHPKKTSSNMNVTDIYLELDTTNRVIGDSNPAKGMFTFKFDKDNENGKELIGVTEAIDHCIGVESFTFLFPRIPPTKYQLNENGEDNELPILKNNGNTVPTNGDLSQVVAPRFTIEIKELGNQSISTSKGTKYTLQYDLLNVEGDDTNLAATYATPSIPGFNFTNTIPKIDKLTLIFRNYLNEPISFNEDNIRDTYATATQFTYDINSPIIPTEEYLTLSLRNMHDVVCDYNNTQNNAVLEGDTINIKYYDKSITNPVLYRYLNSATVKLKVGNVNNLWAQLNPDIGITKYINARSTTFNKIDTTTKNIIEYKTKTIPLDPTTQIVIREWKEINRPAPFTDLGLNTDKSFKDFREGEYFYINGNKYTPCKEHIMYKGDSYFINNAKDIYYDRVIFTKHTSTVIIDNVVDQGGVISNKYNVNVPIKTGKYVKLKENQVFIKTCLRTNLTDTYSDNYASFNGESLRVGSSFRLFHQGARADDSTVPVPTNDVYHIEKNSNILANGVIATRGLSGFGNISIILNNNSIKIPMRFRTVTDKVTNYLYV